MLRAVFGPMRSRRGSDPSPKPAGWLQNQVAPFLSSISQQACTHPIHTLVVIAIMASTTYIGLLQSSLFDPLPSQTNPAGQVEFSSLLTGSKTLHTSKDTNWKWQNGDSMPADTLNSDLALLTFVFPDSAYDGTAAAPPQAAAIPQMNNSSIQVLPSSKNFLSPISQETTLAVSVPFDIAPDFLNSLRELPLASKSRGSPYRDDQTTSTAREEKRWMMSAAKGDVNGSQKGFRGRVADAWTAFLDLLKNAEELDIIIMVLGYLSMHLTFVSLFVSLRRLGSNFWLGATTLCSSIFAFLFGLTVTTRFNVPINMVLLSEGLPFLVVTIGFEKPIILTKAVLQAALALKKSSRSGGNARLGGKQEQDPSPDIRTAIQVGVQDCGYEIVRDYAIEILILVAGAASGVQGGLCQFCFLAAWILFFDCILLFTFYTAILTIKLEINRIKRHMTLRRVLEEDGVSRKVAEEVASNDEWPKLESSADGTASSNQHGQQTFLGFKAKDTSVSKFKLLMVTGFIIINILNFCTAPFRNGGRSTGSALSSVVTQPLMDPFKVAGSGLDILLTSAKARNHATSVTVLTPIKYELEYPSVHYAAPVDESSIFDMGFTDQFMDGVGGKVVEGVLKSFEDPVLSKWIIVALAMSLVLNGYLFNAARWSIKEPPQQLSANEHVEQQQGAAASRARSPSKLASNATVTGSSAAQSQLVELQRAQPLSDETSSPPSNGRIRRQSECEALLKDKRGAELNDEELIGLCVRGKIPGYALEKTIGDKTRAVKVRRGLVARTPATAEFTGSLEASKLPYENYDYDLVHGACCENVIGYLPLPLGVAGPMLIDGTSYYIPMATTEGVLVASTSRGAKAINAGGGVTTVLTGDGMTRGPCVSFSSLSRAGEAKIWLDSEAGQTVIRNAFNSTSRFARLQTLRTALAGTYLFIRFKTTTGDAMGMNMISKGVEHALHVMSTEAGFDDMQIISVSGNYCTDKKPSAINWIDGRGKSVVAEAVVPGEVVRNVLKSDVAAMVELNVGKNLIGSAMAGSIGGQNAHAANIVTALFLATGQDPAQNVESCNCITVMKNVNGNLQISVSMPCIEVGTIGGGTFLGPQAAMLDLLGVRGAHATSPGSNSRQLARIVAASVLAGELSLCAALAAGHLVRAHMQHNRSQTTSRATTPAPNNRTPLPKNQSSASLIMSSITNVTGSRDR